MKGRYWPIGVASERPPMAETTIHDVLYVGRLLASAGLLSSLHRPQLINPGRVTLASLVLDASPI